MNLPNGWELILLLLVVVLVFGAKRLPDSARALGRSMRILKAETKGMRDDEPATSTTAHVVEPLPPVQPTAPAPAPTAPYVGQQLFDAQGRPVAQPGSVVIPPAAPADRAAHPQA